MSRTATGQPQPVEVKSYYDDAVLLDKLRAWTWTTLPEVPYALKNTDTRRDLGWLSTLAFAAVKTGQVHLIKRPSSMLHQIGGWRQAREEHVQTYGNPSERYPDLLDQTEARMQQVNPYGRQVFMGVELGRRSLYAQALEACGGFTDEPVHPKEAARWTKAAADRRDALRRGGLRARPMTALHLRQLRQHLAYRGLDVPEPSTTGRRWFGHAETTNEFLDVEMRPVQFPTTKGLRSCLKVVSPASNEATYTASWVVSLMPQGMAFPKTPPWLAHADGLAFPAEVHAHLDLVSPRTALRQIKGRLLRARDQDKDARYADIDLPIEVSEVIDLAREWEYTIPKRRMPMVWGHVVLRVDADSPEQLAAMFDQAEEHYKLLDIDLAWPGGMSQTDLALQSIPGAPRNFSSYQQMWPIETIGCGLIQAGSGLAHPNGVYAGYTTGRVQQAVTWNPHWAITRTAEHSDEHVETAGGFTLEGMPRAGKSGALITIAYDAAEAGIRTVLVDLGGETAKMQGLAPDRIDVVDVLAAGGGAADPMSPLVIPGSWDDEVVRNDRMHLTYETFATFARDQVRASAVAKAALITAIQKVALSEHPSSAAVLDVLVKDRAKDVHALGKTLEFGLGSRAGKVLIGEGGEQIASGTVKPLTILKGQGLVMAEADKPIERWSSDELLGAAVFGIVAHRARQMVWGRGKGNLSLVILDEAHIPLAVPAGLSVCNDLFRHGPKNGTATGLATHSAEALDHAFIRIGTSSRFVFRAQDDREVSLGLRNAGIEDNKANRNRRRNLRNGECMAVYPDDTRDIFRWDQWHPGVRQAADTTAGRRLAVA